MEWISDQIEALDGLLAELDRLQILHGDEPTKGSSEAELSVWREQMLDILIPLADSPLHKDVRKSILYALSKIASPRAAEILRRAVVQEEDEAVRCSCADALSVVGGCDSVHALVAAMQDSSAYVSYTCSRALGRLAGTDPGLRSYAGAHLIEVIGRAHGLQKRRLIRSLGDIGTLTRDEVKALSAHLSDPDASVRCEVVDTLRRSRSGVAITVFIDALSDVSRDVRLTALKALEQAGDKRAVSPLIRLCIENEDMREESLKVLGSICGKKALGPVLQAISSIHKLAASTTAKVLYLSEGDGPGGRCGRGDIL